MDLIIRNVRLADRAFDEPMDGIAKWAFARNGAGLAILPPLPGPFGSFRLGPPDGATAEGERAAAGTFVFPGLFLPNDDSAHSNGAQSISWRKHMHLHRQFVGWIAGGLLILTGALGSPAFAVPVSAAGSIRAASSALDPVEKAQYYWDGYYWCWYDFGWHGPGWYVCDYGPWVEGYWWGGGFGWHHWRWHGRRLHGPYHHHGKQHPNLYHGKKPGTKGGYKGTQIHPGTKVYKGTQIHHQGPNVYRGNINRRSAMHGPTHVAPSFHSAPSFRSGGGGGGGGPSFRSGGGGGGGGGRGRH